MSNLPVVEKKAQNEDEVIKEMLPFFFYATIPLIITILLAWSFGPSH